MPTPAERRALLFFASLALLGAGWRTVRRGAPTAGLDEGQPALASQLAAVDSARNVAAGRGTPRPVRGRASRSVAKSPPLTRSTRRAPVDMDRATPEELEALPGIGPALARRIVADREVNGAFGSLEALERVRGVGPAMARELAPLVTFSMSGVAGPVGSMGRSAGRRANEPTRRGQIIWPGGSPRGGPPP